MNVEQRYKEELDNLRKNPESLNLYSIDAAKDNNRNQINRNRILIALYNDCQENDYKIADYLFYEEKKLRQSARDVDDYEVDVLYLAAFILTKFDHVEDIWKFIDSKMTDYDSSIGFDTEYLLAFGLKNVFDYLNHTDHPNKRNVIKLIGESVEQCKYTQNEINDWKKNKHDYFCVFKFPINDYVDFLFQAKEYTYLKEILPEWMITKDNWTEKEHLTTIAIGSTLNLDNIRLQALESYNEKFKKSVRVRMNKQEIATIESPIRQIDFWMKFKRLFIKNNLFQK